MLLSNLLMIVATTLAAPADSQTPDGALTSQPLAVIRPVEVRIRRLHVVRPDLLRFPITYDTLC